jgi:hypothetical protein
LVVDKDTVTSFAMVACGGVVVMVTHTMKVESPSATFTVVGISNTATARE